MARLTEFEVSGYRSVSDGLSIRFPPGKPLVIVGENNAGKSNLVGCLEKVLGDRWPASWMPEDHDFHNGDREGLIRISAEVSEVDQEGSLIEGFDLTHEAGITKINARFLNGQTRWPKKQTLEQLPCMVVGADRKLSYQLSYTSQWTMLSKLMHRFHKVLVAEEKRLEDLKSNFEALHKIFDQVPEYATFTEQLKSEASTLATNMQYSLDMDFSAYDPSNFFKALRVRPSLNGETKSYDELGTGQEQILALSFAYAYASAFASTGNGLILVIEEPEAHLHPLAQSWLAQQLHRFTNEGVQIVITTHSPAFIDMRNLDSLVLLRKEGRCSTSSQLSARHLAEFCQAKGATKATPDNIFEHYDINATDAIRAGFFARSIVLVEGPTESFALPILLRKLGVDLAKQGTACIEVGGKGNLAKWWRIFTAYDIPTYIIFDNDRKDDKSSTKRCDILTTLSVDEAEQESLTETTDLEVRDTFTIMGIDYEKVLSKLVPSYQYLQTQCVEHNGPLGKPFAARWIAEKLEPQEITCLNDLAEAIQKLGSSGVQE